MSEITVVFADTHCGYLYDQYPGRGERLDLARSSLLAFAGCLNELRSRIACVVCVGDLAEKLYPTPQSDLELARLQLQPISRLLRREGWPLVYLAGNCDPYYDSQVQRRMATAARAPENWSLPKIIESLLFAGPINLQLPGLCHLDQESDLLFTHGHLFDRLIGESMPGRISQRAQPRFASQIIRQALAGVFKRASVRRLQRCEKEHLLLGRLYEYACWLLSCSPGSWRQAIDAKLAEGNLFSQMLAGFDATKNLPCDGIVAGHVHAAAMFQSDDGGACYLNPGTLTAAFKIAPAASNCTFAIIVNGVASMTIELFQCDRLLVRSIGSKVIRRRPQL